jgi:hypothetical protein
MSVSSSRTADGVAVASAGAAVGVTAGGVGVVMDDSWSQVHRDLAAGVFRFATAFGRRRVRQRGFLGFFFGVALMIQGQQAVEDFSTGGFGNRVADALLGFVEAVS